MIPKQQFNMPQKDSPQWLDNSKAILLSWWEVFTLYKFVVKCLELHSKLLNRPHNSKILCLLFDLHLF